MKTLPKPLLAIWVCACVAGAAVWMSQRGISPSTVGYTAACVLLALGTVPIALASLPLVSFVWMFLPLLLFGDDSQVFPAHVDDVGLN